VGAVLHFLSRCVLAFIDALSTLAGALGIRWLLGYSTPERDWQTIRRFVDSLHILIIVPDPMAGINLAYIQRMRDNYQAGGYAGDTIPDGVESTESGVDENAPQE
jgi:hypothetical protein